MELKGVSCRGRKGGGAEGSVEELETEALQEVRCESAGLHRTGTLQARRATAERRRVGARGEARRISHATACRRSRGNAEDAQGSRLDRQVPADRRPRGQAPGL